MKRYQIILMGGANTSLISAYLGGILGDNANRHYVVELVCNHYNISENHHIFTNLQEATSTVIPCEYVLLVKPIPMDEE